MPSPLAWCCPRKSTAWWTPSRWTITDGSGTPRQYVLKNQFMVMEILRNNNWERPVYFAVTIGPDSYVGLQDYFRLGGPRLAAWFR